VTLTNTGTSTAYDVADIIDVLPAGLGTASLVSAKLNSSSVAGAPGFSLSQSGQQVTITVRNAGGQARLAAGDVYEVRYSVPLTSSINGSIASLMNKASVANYSTGAADGGPRETLTDVAPASVTLAVDSNVISGRVIFSKETASAGQQNGVSGTTVVLVGTAFTATTDSEGVFLMQGVPDGTYTVRATSSFGDVLSEQTITVTNSDSRNVVFQARPRVTLTKTASTAGPVYPGQEITYTLTLQNVGNYPAFQVSDVVDTLAKGLGNATLTSATYNSTSVTGVAGFAFTQSGQVVTARVRNSSNQPRLNVGDIYLVSYTVPVNSALKAASLTIPNSAELASYATAPTSGYTTESYFDIRCGEVRLETSADHPDCKVSDLNPTIDLMKARIARMRQGVSKAIALRKEFVKAGYCKAADNGCYKCSGTRKKCLNTCRPPSASEDAALVSRALQLKDGANNTIASDLFTQTWTLICSSYSECSLADVASAKDSIEAAGDTMATDMQAVLDSCCMRTARARQALRQRRASLKLAAKLDAKRLSTLMEVYPNPGLVCPAG
jgi:fimbrial isopeptide formation D2 family protein